MVNAPGTRSELSPDELRSLFHQLNNHLGVLLANAELIEAKSAEPTTQARAHQMVASVLEALDAARSLRSHIQAVDRSTDPD